MNKFPLSFLCFSLITFSGCGSSSGVFNSDSLNATGGATGVTQWAKTEASGTANATFRATTVAPDGSMYAVGQFYGAAPFTLQSGFSLTGGIVWNPVIAKYDSSGNVLWATSVTAINNYGYYYGVANTPDGGVVAVGAISGLAAYNFGNGVTATSSNTGTSIVVVKYNSAGVAQWAQSASSGANATAFYGVSVTSDGSIYAAGTLTSNIVYSFGNGVTAQGPVVGVLSPLLVKYNSSGVTQWAQTATSSLSLSTFGAVSAAPDGSVYVVGSEGGAGSFSLGGCSITGPSTSTNAFLAKYNSAGACQWVQGLGTSTSASYYAAVVVTPDSNSVYAAGSMVGSPVSFGSGVTASPGNATVYNAVVAKYNSAGAAQWASAPSSSSGASVISSLALDTFGNIYAAGYFSGVNSVTFGSGIVSSGTSTNTALLATYDGSGNALWVDSVNATAGPSASFYYGLSSSSDGHLYAVGSLNANYNYNFGSNIVTAGAVTNQTSVVVAQYK